MDASSTTQVVSGLNSVYTIGNGVLKSNTVLNYENGEFSVGEQRDYITFTATGEEDLALASHFVVRDKNVSITGSSTVYTPTSTSPQIMWNW